VMLGCIAANSALLILTTADVLSRGNAFGMGTTAPVRASTSEKIVLSSMLPRTNNAIPLFLSPKSPDSGFTAAKTYAKTLLERPITPDDFAPMASCSGPTLTNENCLRLKRFCARYTRSGCVSTVVTIKSEPPVGRSSESAIFFAPHKGLFCSTSPLSVIFSGARGSKAEEPEDRRARANCFASSESIVSDELTYNALNAPGVVFFTENENVVPSVAFLSPFINCLLGS